MHVCHCVLQEAIGGGGEADRNAGEMNRRWKRPAARYGSLAVSLLASAAAQRPHVMQLNAGHLAAVERLRRLRRPFPASGWTRELFAEAAREGKRRWEE